MDNQFPTLAEAFLNYFDVELVCGEDMAARAAGVRYRVYCEEFGFEAADEFPDHMETDEFDAYSLQCLISHKRSGLDAGCVRVVCASESEQLPLEKYCLDSVYLEFMGTLNEDRDALCEFSRLAVDATFRKRSGEGRTKMGEFDALDCSHQEQRTFSLVGIAAFLAAFALAKLSGRTQIFAMMETNLPRLLRQAGILVERSGDTVNYHGERAAYFITVERALQNMRDDLQLLYDAIWNCLAVGFDTKEDVA